MLDTRSVNEEWEFLFKGCSFARIPPARLREWADGFIGESVDLESCDAVEADQLWKVEA
jgi:hypothetical protein